ncbi:hypothetical protein PAMP_001088 [Pampus punctatissimus]
MSRMKMTRKGKGQKSEKSSCEEDFVEKDANSETAEQTNAIAANSAAVNLEIPATNENILVVNHQMKSAVDSGFDQLKGSLSSLKSAISALSDHVSTTEDAIATHEKRLYELERRHESLSSQCMLQQGKIDDLEAHSRRQNIRIIGITKKAENGVRCQVTTRATGRRALRQPRGCGPGPSDRSGS